MNALKEVQKVFPSLIKKMPSEKATVVESKQRAVESSVKGMPKQTQEKIQPEREKVSSTPRLRSSPPQKMFGKRGAVSSSIPGYNEMVEGLEMDKEGKHEEAMVLYKRAGELGNKAAFINMGNCYMFGKGVDKYWEKGIEMYGKCGGIKSEDLGWVRELSNDRYVGETKLFLRGLFFILLTLSYYPLFLHGMTLVTLVLLHYLMH